MQNNNVKIFLKIPYRKIWYQILSFWISVEKMAAALSPIFYYRLLEKKPQSLFTKKIITIADHIFVLHFQCIYVFSSGDVEFFHWLNWKLERLEIMKRSQFVYVQFYKMDLVVIKFHNYKFSKLWYFIIIYLLILNFYSHNLNQVDFKKAKKK